MLRVIGVILLLLGWLPVCAVGSAACYDFDASSELSVASALENLTDFADLEEVGCPPRSSLESATGLTDVPWFTLTFLAQKSVVSPQTSPRSDTIQSLPLLQANNWQFLLRAASAPRAPSLA